MKTIDADVVVIGGGSTGVGVVRDAAMRGFKAVLVERADLGQGTTGRFHGLLHSGGRYVVSDPESATECAEENVILKRIQADAIEDTGGLFVTTAVDAEDFADGYAAACVKAKVPIEEISLKEAFRREPLLNRGSKRAFAVEDGTIDGWKLVWGAVRSAEQYGGTILTYHSVTKIEHQAGQATAVTCLDRRSGETVRIGCHFVLNCAGPWGGQIAAMAGCHDVEVVPGAGIMIAMNHRLTQSVLNRCIYPADGDILVPAHPVCIIGTTDHKAGHADDLPIPRDQVQQMLDAGEEMIPGFRKARAIHAWAGARPLVKDSRVSAEDTRHMARGMSIIDHEHRDGLKGLLTIAGGKLTTYRLMAERIVDVMCDQLGEKRECRTADEPVPGSEDRKLYALNRRLEQVETGTKAPSGQQIICECELVTRKKLIEAMNDLTEFNLDDLRRQVRLGMGPCQGGFCASRATGIAHQRDDIDAEHASELLRGFLKNRWIGIWPILHGEQVRQTALDSWIFEGTLDLEHLPEPERQVV
ncbi:anaerobic glycerol-3-phosphate dehydrogenase subunit GlpA [Tessaracoccus caeni]|uniref:anaerobic glycerol-3-phosphate dehydrogenase subunit GlpA n=1 Tax=Tessaracoccus caeni TaxID=3031239 RepID=UPI0023DADE07|nr:anaerobic glycerol-3-phosphate dehydrogenase subunit GlpA [Tessaracoccus caeni]MDF1486888.1 anaerobic glycerol-3-phosphate dehydrogenase subunit GlpA [Tessaracoccus caeni]